MSLTEEAFTALVDRGCPRCHGKKLTVEALVAQRIPLLGGEPYGAASWAYKGEDLVYGTYRIACDACKEPLFSATACPRCDAEGGVERALAGESAFALPRSCNACHGEQLVATALVPVIVVYEGQRAARARARAGPEEPGFHATRIECKGCRNSVERRDPCPLCSEA